MKLNKYFELKYGHNNFFIISLLIAVASFNSCQALQDLAEAQKPNLSVQDVRVTDFAFDEVELTFDVKVENPNPFELQLTSYNYAFKINENTFVEGERPRGLLIEGSQASIIHVPVTIDFQQLYDLYNSLKGEDRANYALLAHLTFNLPVLGKTTIPLKKTGKVPLIRLPEVSIAGLRVQEMNLRNINFELVLAVNNPNAFGLVLNNLSYRLEVNGEEWVESSFRNQVKITSNERGIITIPISLNTLNIGSSAIEIVQSAENLHYSLEGTLDVTARHPLLGDTDFSFFGEGVLPAVVQ